MGLVGADGNSVLTTNVTQEQHKAMSQFYTFILKKYFEIVPANQQQESPTGAQPTVPPAPHGGVDNPWGSGPREAAYASMLTQGTPTD